MIASLLACNVTDSAAELALDDDQCLVEQRPSSGSRNHCKVRKQIRQADIELSGRRVNARIGLVDVLVVVPTAERDLNVSGPKPRPKDVAGCDTCVAEP